ncbi:MAG: hypothetical protein HUK21_11285 [Fibrobacteraceae bacterium]|nr:hypothetical protein [Fibrobacteraceae bacterium]
MILTRILLILLITLSTTLSAKEPSSKKTPLNAYDIDFTKYPFIDTTLNTIQFPKGNQSFTQFFNRLDTLVFENRGKIRILHIGGSHLQADVMSGRIREHLTTIYPGASAGRGFVFPYAAARTNTPSSYGSYYKGIWDMSKNVLKDIKKPLGLLGIAVSTSDPRAEISILLNRYNNDPIWNETKIRLFGYSDNKDVVPVLCVDSMEYAGMPDTASQSYVFTPPRPIDTIKIKFRWLDSLKQATVAQFITDSLVQDSIAKANADTTQKDSSKDTVVKHAPQAPVPGNVALPLDSMYQDSSVFDTVQQDLLALDAAPIDTSSQTKTSSNERPRFTLTGILTETDFPGISYTNVGINGARVSDYFKQNCPMLEKELNFFKPDLVIFAIGINDANVVNFNSNQFRADYDTLITRIKNVNPNAALIFVTNNDSYRKVKKTRFVQHPNGEKARQAFFKLAEKYGAGVWDTFSIMGGLGSMSKWEKADLAKKDKVHFKASGYNLLGDMFYKALVEAYQEHISNLPAQDAEAPNSMLIKEGK